MSAPVGRFAASGGDLRFLGSGLFPAEKRNRRRWNCSRIGPQVDSTAIPYTDNRRSGRSVRKHLIGDDRQINANPDVSAGANAIKIARDATAPMNRATSSLIKSQYLGRQQSPSSASDLLDREHPGDHVEANRIGG